MVVCGSDSKHFVITLKSFCDKRRTTNALQRETATKNRVQKCLVEVLWHTYLLYCTEMRCHDFQQDNYIYVV